MKRTLPVLAFFAVVAAAVAADFPAPESLPAQPGLPDPLLMLDGTRITTAEAWKTKRAPELRALFQHYMYGTMPAARPVSGKLLREDKTALDGKATLREIEVSVGLERPVHLMIVTPNAAKKPAACFLGLTFGGSYQLVDDPLVQMPRGWVSDKYKGAPENRAGEEGRGKQKDAWAIAQSIERGYAVATFYQGDVIADEKTQAEDGLKTFHGKTERGDADTATISAWAWTFSRIMDYLVTVPEIDPRRIAVVGHSRNGKTALLAAAFDERIALVIPSQAGSGGTGPSRVAPELAALQPNGRPTAETTAVINKNFPHWFCGNFKKFDAAPEKLPFDQHALIALCAPRPVLLSNAEGDRWANPDGQYAMLRAAAPVYALFGDKLALPAERPALNSLLNEKLGYFIRPGTHSMTTPDWQAWLDYADRWLK